MGICTDDWVPGITKTIGTKSLVYFGAPYTSPIYTIDLPPPEFGESRYLNQRLIIHGNSSGIIRVFHPSYINVTWTFDLVFDGLTTAQAAAFETFLINTAGADMKYIDQEYRTWRGVILTPDPGFVMNRSCDYTVQIQLYCFLIAGAP